MCSAQCGALLYPLPQELRSKAILEVEEYLVKLGFTNIFVVNTINSQVQSACVLLQDKLCGMRAALPPMFLFSNGYVSD
jgi:hypothetical protein